ncbi:MAG: radical SAM protein [Myxococcota bacterium]
MRKDKKEFRAVLMNPFLFPPVWPNSPFLYSRFPANVPDVALAGIAAAAKPRPVDILDGWNSDIGFEEFVSYSDKYSLVGIRVVSSFTSIQARALAAAIKARSPETVVVLGGHHATLYSKKWLEFAPEVDAVVRGEGENTFRELFDSLSSGGSFSGIAGVSWRNVRGQIIEEAPRSLEKSLDNFPPPLFDLWEKRRYTPTILGSGTAGTIESSRGCSTACGFCAVGAMWNNRQRWKSIERILTEVEAIKRLGINNFIFADDNFNGKPDFSLDLCDEVAKFFPGVSWGTMASAKPFFTHPELAEAMARAGCRYLVIGFENVEKTALSALHKGHKAVTPENGYEKVFKTLDRAGIIVIGLFIYGWRGETEEELMAMVELSNKICHFRGLNPFEIIHGTPLYPDYETMKTSDFYKLFPPFYKPPQRPSIPAMFKVRAPTLIKELARSAAQRNFMARFFALKNYYIAKALIPPRPSMLKFSKIAHNPSLSDEERMTEFVNETIKSAREIGKRHRK